MSESLDDAAPVIDRLYSSLHPWRDLRGFISGGWEASSPAGHLPFWARINRDMIDIYATIGVGSSQNFTTALHEALLPDRTRSLSAFQSGHGPTVAQITTSGIFRVDPNAGFTQNQGTLMIISSYPRRA